MTYTFPTLCAFSLNRCPPQNASVVLRHQNGLSHPYGLVVEPSTDSRVFYWTEFKAGEVRRYDTATNTTVVWRNDSLPLYEIRMYDSRRQTGTCDGD